MSKFCTVLLGNIVFYLKFFIVYLFVCLFVFILGITGCPLSGGSFYVLQGKILCEKDYRVSSLHFAKYCKSGNLGLSKYFCG